jgi:hypothetical protein
MAATQIFTMLASFGTHDDARDLDSNRIQGAAAEIFGGCQFDVASDFVGGSSGSQGGPEQRKTLAAKRWCALMMRPTVLTWDDIDVLVGLCSRSFPEGPGSPEPARQRLVTTVHQYLKMWRPQGELDDIYRIALVRDLGSLCVSIEKADGGEENYAVMVAESRRIAGLLKQAMGIS